MAFIMTKEEALKFFGSGASPGKAIGLTRSAIHMWGDKIPLPSQFQLEVISNGALIADRSASVDSSARTRLSK